MFTINGKPIIIGQFPDGTVKLDITVDAPAVEIQWLYEQGEEMTLYFIARHIKQHLAAQHVTLNMPYVPHARMDRVKEASEVFTLKYFCEFINGLRFDRVIVRDAHSSVASALLDRVQSEDMTQNITALANSLLDPQTDIVFYPDEGSCKRYAGLLAFPCAFGIKKRDWKTGSIEGLEVQGALPRAPFNALIIDDICSYGGTFLHAARRLKELGADKIYLYVTHCENSVLKGDLIGSGLLEKIYTTKSILTQCHPLITVIGED